MNIAFDAGAIEVAKGSGIGNYTLHQFDHMMRLYPEHTFFYFNLIEDSALTERFTRYPNFNKAYFYTGRHNLLLQYKGEYQDLLGALIRKFIIKNRIDVFYVTAPFLATNAVYQKEWFNGIQVVATVYDVIPYIMRKKYLPTSEAFEWYMSCIDMVKWTDRQLVISNYTRDDMVQHLQFDPAKIEVIHSGVSDKYRVLDITQAEKNAIYQKWGIRPGSAFFLCGVSADHRKNTEGIIKAYAQLPKSLRDNYQMVIAGRLAYKAKHEALIRRLGVAGQVILTDYIPDDDELIKLYNLSLFVVIPSLYEGFGLPVVEAWACGKAVLASNNSSLGELVGDTGLSFDPYNIRDMARGLTEALTTADLSDLARRGYEKLSAFRWENVAKLSMEAICQQAAVAGPSPIPKDRHITCLFVRKEYYTAPWEKFLDRLKETYSVAVHLETLPEDPVGTIVYFVSAHRLGALGDTHRYPKGTAVILDRAMQQVVETVTGVDDETGHGVIVGEYLTPANTKDFALAGHKLIVADARQKHRLLSNPSLLGRVYALSPVVGHRIHTPPAVKKRLGDMAFQNFLSALSDEAPRSNPVLTLGKLKTRETDPQSYTTAESRALSASVGFALGTEAFQETASLRAIRFDGQDAPPLKVAMVSSWNTICGIAEYTKYFIENVSAAIDFEVWPNRVKEDAIDDDITAPRLWEHHGDVRELVSGLLGTKPDIVHIQYTVGFFSVQGLTDIIESMHHTARVIVSCHNTNALRPENEHQRTLLNRAYFTVHQKSDIDLLCANGIEPTRISLIPLGQVTVPDRTKESVKRILGLEDRYPIVGGFGFLFKHKGVYETIEAIAVLKEKYPHILYIACNALYNAPASRWYYKECKALIDRLALKDHVKMVTDFLSPEESLYLLQACDLSVLPYAKTSESASGAARFCVAARRPLVLTDQPIFADLSDCAVFVKNEHCDAIADGIERLLQEPVYTQKTEAVKVLAGKNTWPDIEKQYVLRYGDPGDPGDGGTPTPEDLVIEQHKRLFGIVEDSAPPSKPLISSLARRGELIAFTDWIRQMGLDPSFMHRKYWEWAYIAQVLHERAMLTPGKRGLGFAVGNEPLPALFARYGVGVTATDLDENDAQADNWRAGKQHSANIAALEHPGVCDKETFYQHVRFMPADMNHIPDTFTDFDFCWSSCAFEHLGSVAQGRAFIFNTLKVLKPGGISVHTTEFNLSSDDSVDAPYSAHFGKHFFAALQKELAAMGHYMAPLDYRLGNHPSEDYIFRFDCVDPHFKLFLDGCVSTSIGIIIVKGGA